MPPKSQADQPAPEMDFARDDSAAVVLRHLESERGRMFTDAEYAEYRRSVLDELAFGPRLRPFTFFTFIAVELAFAALLVVGVTTTSGRGWRDFGLALASLLAMICGAIFFGLLRRGVKRDEERSLDDRLRELEEVRTAGLITLDEYHELNSQILHRRQCSGRV